MIKLTDFSYWSFHFGHQSTIIDFILLRNLSDLFNNNKHTSIPVRSSNFIITNIVCIYDTERTTVKATDSTKLEESIREPSKQITALLNISP